MVVGMCWGCWFWSSCGSWSYCSGSFVSSFVAVLVAALKSPLAMVSATLFIWISFLSLLRLVSCPLFLALVLVSWCSMLNLILVRILIGVFDDDLILVKISFCLAF